MKQLLTITLIFICLNAGAQIRTNTDSILNVLSLRIAKLEADSTAAGPTLELVNKTLNVNQKIINQLSTMQATITSQQAAIEALRVRLAGLKITAVIL